MFQILSTYFKIIQYKICYYFLGIFAVLDDLKDRDKNKFGKTVKYYNLINIFRYLFEACNFKVIKYTILYTHIY